MDSIVLFFEKRLSFWNDKILRVFCAGFSIWNALSFAKNERSFRWCFLFEIRTKSVHIFSFKWEKNDCLFGRKQEGEESSFRIDNLCHIESKIPYHIELIIRRSHIKMMGRIRHFKMRVLPIINPKQIWK